jgi:dTDP-4-amino-4,6-dideoxygalactose transaminase
MSPLDHERVPFNWPYLAPNCFEYMKQAVEGGRISGAGRFTQICEETLADITGASRALLTTSCTHALEMAALLLDLQPGDEVIVPSFTFVSTANAFAMHGARPRFCDVRGDTLNLDERLLEPLIGPRTKAIVVVHYAGIACEMDAILECADRHGLPVIEDAAHALLGTYKGEPLGGLGRMATLSFHETKNIACGEGGALLLNDPADAALVARAEILREKGTDRSRFSRGEIGRYTWVDKGSSYVISELLAAYLAAQLEVRDVIQSQRRAVWDRYYDALSPWAGSRGASLPQGRDNHPYHMFFMLMPSRDVRDRLISTLRQDGVDAVFHYVPLHLSPMGAAFGASPDECPVTVDVSDRLVRLPFYTGMTESVQSRVIEAVLRFA